MNWFRSRVFWKFFGIYILSSGLALLGMLLALQDATPETILPDAATEIRAIAQQLSQDLRNGDVARRDSVGAGLRAEPSSASDSLLNQHHVTVTLLTMGDTDAENAAPGAGAPANVAASVVRRLIQMISGEESGIAVLLNPGNSRQLCAVTRIGSPEQSPSRYLLVTMDLNPRLLALSASHRRMRRACLVTWGCGVISFLLVSVLVLEPILRLIQASGVRGSTLVRRDELMRMADRRDEFGSLGQSMLDRDQLRRDEQEHDRQQQGELQAAVSRLSAVLQAMSEGVIAVDASEVIVFANEPSCRMLQAEHTAITGRRIFEVIRNNHLQESVQETLSTGKLGTLEFRLPRSGIMASVVTSAIDGPKSGAVLVLRDQTEVRRLEQVRRDFFSGVSHELKTPLTVIQACTETLLDGAVSDIEVATRFLQQINEQSERLQQLILGMLQLSRLEAGRELIHPEPVNLVAMADGIVSSFRPIAESRQIQLTQNGPDELFVLTDLQAVSTVVSNLVDNAIKYTPAGGQVTVELVSEPERAVLRVSDNGVGIPPEHQNRVFERFYRVKRDRNRESGGTGLGLAIVKHLAAAVHAELSLDSREGSGTTISVAFPRDSTISESHDSGETADSDREC